MLLVQSDGYGDQMYRLTHQCRHEAFWNGTQVPTLLLFNVPSPSGQRTLWKETYTGISFIFLNIKKAVSMGQFAFFLLHVSFPSEIRFYEDFVASLILDNVHAKAVPNFCKSKFLYCAMNMNYICDISTKKRSTKKVFMYIYHEKTVNDSLLDFKSDISEQVMPFINDQFSY